MYYNASEMEKGLGILNNQKISSKFPVWITFSGHLTNDLYESFIIGLIPILKDRFVLSLFMVALLTSVGTLSGSLSQPIFGYLADRLQIKYFMVFGLLLHSILLSIIGILPNYYLILIFIFIGNLGNSAFHPSSASVAGHFGGSRKGLSSSLIALGGHTGYSIGALIIILIFTQFGLKYVPIAMILGIIMALIIYKYIPSVNLNKSIDNILVQNSYKRIIRNAGTFPIIIIFLSSYIKDLIWLALVTFMPLYLKDFNLKLINIGFIILLFSLMGGLGGLITGTLYDKYKKGIVNIQINLIISIVLIYLLFHSEVLMIPVIFIITGFFLISTQPIYIRIFQDIFPKNLSLSSSVVLGFSAGLAAVTMIFLGKVADKIGSSRLITYLLIPLFIMTVFLVFLNIFNKRFSILKNISL